MHLQNMHSEELVKDLDLPVPDSEELNTKADYSSKVQLYYNHCIDITTHIYLFTVSK